CCVRRNGGPDESALPPRSGHSVADKCLYPRARDPADEPGRLPRDQPRQTRDRPRPVPRQRRQSLEPDCPPRSSLPGIPETACSAPDPPPQRSASSDPSAIRTGIIPRESNKAVRFHTARSGRIEARIGLRMMPTFPRSSLSFRTAGFPQYGWKAGFPNGAFPDCPRLKPAPGIRRPISGLHPPFVHLVVTTVVPHCVGPQTRLRTAVEDHYSSAPGAFAQVRVILSRSVITYSPVSNVGDIWSLEEGTDEGSIVLDID